MIEFFLFLSLQFLSQQGEAEPSVAAEGQTMEADESAQSPLESVDPFAYSYNPFGKRDPFRSFLIDQKEAKEDISNPLLSYDLSKFVLTGIVWGITNPRAIVLDGGNKGHIIRRGTRIGRNRGRVVRILKNRVVIAEEFRDPLGKLIVSEYSMKLDTENGK